MRVLAIGLTLAAAPSVAGQVPRDPAPDPAPDTAPGAASARAEARIVGSAGESALCVRVVGAAGGRALAYLRARPMETGGGRLGWVPLGWLALDRWGRGQAVFPLAPRGARPGAGFELRAEYLRGGARATTTTTELTLENPAGQRWSFDWDQEGAPLPAGTDVSALQPWSGFAQVTADNADGTHPDVALLVDGDGWPGPGLPAGAIGTRLAERMLAIAADVTDADGDGRVDTPRAEPAGGVLAVDFPGPSLVSRLTFFDVDEPGGQVSFYDGPQLLQQLDLPVGPPRTSTTLWTWVHATRVEVAFAGAAALRSVTLLPCPSLVDFDETATGTPTRLTAGAEVWDEYGGLGLYPPAVSAQNNAPGHPDRAIVFESANPSGGDADLITPGYGLGNGAPLRNVLILAEDDVDADGDGRVDDPSAEPAGGSILFSWATSDVWFRSATVLDVDSDETGYVRVHISWPPSFVDLPFASLGDNSVQTVTGGGPIGPTRAIEFVFSGTLGIAELVTCPE